ncbi:unnamed protein product [Leptidea sinapis]|uniref:Uncharacterized protein n=1 Tax=Leptidea sinapis TaxID=189913 RepID=A0A5E4R1J0_9NEOP|nr:unnamed protein product [Leptidea sinapis]
MTTYWQILDNIKKYVTHIQESGSSKDYQPITLQLEHQLREIEHYNQLLQNQLSRRQKRGLNHGVGYVANSLFGVLDERFANQYQLDIERIKQNQNHLQTLLPNQTIIVETEYNILKRHESLIYAKAIFSHRRSY